MKMIPCSLLIFFSVLFFSCHKSLENYNPDFKGYWVSDTLVNVAGDSVVCYLDINNPNSSFGWMCLIRNLPAGQRPYGCFGFHTGKAKISKNRKHLLIGGELIIEAKINEEPNQLPSGKWTLVFDDLRYYKQQ